MSDQQPTTSRDAAPAQWAELAGRPATPESLLALTGADPTAMTGAALVDAVVASEKALSLLAARRCGCCRRWRCRSSPATRCGWPRCWPGRTASPKTTTPTRSRTSSRRRRRRRRPPRSPPRCGSPAAPRPAGRGSRHHDRCPRAHPERPGTGIVGPGEGPGDRRALEPLDPEQTQELQDLVLPGAGELTTSELREVAGEVVIIVDPEAPRTGTRKLPPAANCGATSRTGWRR